MIDLKLAQEIIFLSPSQVFFQYNRAQLTECEP